MTVIRVPPIVGHDVLFPRGHVSIRLGPEHRRAYRRLYGLTFPLADVPPLKDHDFDGRSIKMSRPQLAALNLRFHALEEESAPGPAGTFRDQERSLTGDSKRLQFLS